VSFPPKKRSVPQKQKYVLNKDNNLLKSRHLAHSIPNHHDYDGINESRVLIIIIILKMFDKFIGHKTFHFNREYCMCYV